MGEREFRILSAFIRKARFRIRLIRFLESFSLAAVGFLLVLLLGQVVPADQGPSYLLVGYIVLGFLSVLWLVGSFVLRIARPIPPRHIAISLEKKFPDLRNDLINALDLYPELKKKDCRFSRELILAHLKETSRKIRGVPLPSPALHQAVRFRFGLALLFGVTLAGVELLNPGSIRGSIDLFLRPMEAIPKTAIEFQMSPGNLIIPKGWSLTIRALTVGSVPQSLQIRLWQAGRPVRVETMEPKGNGQFAFTIPSVTERIDYQAFAGGSSSLVYRIQVADLPEVGNLKLIIYPPDYSKLPVQTRHGGGEALAGSTVKVELEATKRVLEALTAFEDGRTLPLGIVDGHRLEGRFVLKQTVGMRFHVKDSLGFENQDPVRYEIRAIPDAVPEIEILGPSQVLSLTGDETLKLSYSAKDDFGLQRVELVAQTKGGKIERFPMKERIEAKAVRAATYEWEIWKMNLSPGDTISYHLEATDNDTISGPKQGFSQSRQISIKSGKDEHQQLGKILRDVNESLLGLLGDYLESEYEPASSNAKPDAAKKSGPETDFAKRAEEISPKIEQALKLMEKDRLSDFATWSDLEALKRNLAYTKENLLRGEQTNENQALQGNRTEQTASELERMALLAEEIGNRVKAKGLEQTAQDLMRSQQRLLQSLENLKNTGSKELDAALKELGKMAEMIRSLSSSLSDLATRFPDEFFNSQAMTGLNFSDMLKGLDEIRKKLMQGDLEGALQAARDLMGQMASMLASLQNAGRMAMGSSLGRMQGEMMRSQNELGEIVREQQDILFQTETLDKRTRAKREALLEDRLRDFGKAAMEKLEEIARLFPDREGDELGGRSIRSQNIDDATVNNLAREMMSKLTRKDLKALQDLAQAERRELSKSPKPGEEEKRDRALQLLDALSERLAGLDARPEELMEDLDFRALQGLSEREGALKERTEAFNQKLKALFELFPALDPEITRNVDQAVSAMAQAEGKLGQKSARQAIPPERHALQSLSQSEQAMGQAMQQLAQRGQLGGMPMPFLIRMGRFRPGGGMIPLPGTPRFPQFDLEGGLTGIDLEKFKLPPKDAHKPPVFREEVMESLKEKYPEEFKEEVESYFRSLSE